ncbi:hypothetical protein [Amycolatopsis magusensis]|uniref:Secreted protein n=1 Tax=Amycolatopsis magusensis TaxID=882444 RepID=A0ABS4PSA0_9PSEU|nr:hypothetical protein [Amycolatopsis magusensis]MBP2181775.1 hypothetical protein [Amycolatopsis magusensis]
MSATPRNAARFIAASTMAVAAVFAGGAGGLVASADPAPQASTETTFNAQDVWIDWKVYSTYEKCRQAGRDMIGVGAVVDYRCTFDSPSWLLELRMVD